MHDYSRGWQRKSIPHHSGHSSSLLKKIFTVIGKIFVFAFTLIWGTFRYIFRQRGVLRKVALLSWALGLIGFISLGALFAYYSFRLPDPNTLTERVIPESTKIFDRNGKLLYEIHGEARRTLVKLEEVPEISKEAIIAIEDKDFYSHGGISLAGIVRSALKNLFTGTRVGGSTITQQFVRNAVLTREKTYTRKIKEIIISIQLERRYGKDEILQLYLNEIPFGSNAYGIQAAAQTFFGKSAKDLTLLESAYLAALPQAPTYYNPYGPHKDALDNRADTVLDLMYEQGYISKDQRNRAQNQQVEFRNFGRGIAAPHFSLYVQDLLAQKYGEISLQEGGLKVTTSLDLDLQTAAEEIVARVVAENETKYNVHNGSLAAIDPRSGEILALVGSRDYFDEENDGAVNVALTLQQPGSSFKPYVYAAAFKKGMNPATMLVDVTTNFGTFGDKEYAPQNYDGKNRGPLSLRSALQGSLNIPAVKTLLLTGLEDSVRTAESMGITTLKDRSRLGPSIVLGGADVKLLEHTAAYGVFAAGGVKHDIVAILKVEDKDGNVLEEYRPSRGKEVLDAQIAYQINNVLSDDASRVYIFGRNNKLHLPDRPAAGKTGTTQDYRDAWMMGYVPSLAAGVWMGNNDNTEMKGGASGSLLPASVWNEFMRKALEGKPVEEFVRPEGITELSVDKLSGKLPTAYTPETKTEIFATFNLPTESDDLHLSDGTTILHSEKPDDPSWEEPVRLWAISNGYSYKGEGNGGSENDGSVNIKISLPDKVTAVPWSVRVEAQTDKQISDLQIFLDNRLLASTSEKILEYTGQTLHTDGKHILTAQAKTTENKIAAKTAALEFSAGLKLILLEPADNEELQFPANLVLEANEILSPAAVTFTRRSAAGKETPILGTVTRQQIGQTGIYTLNWPDADKPPTGSYRVWGIIGADKSGEITIKIP